MAGNFSRYSMIVAIFIFTTARLLQHVASEKDVYIIYMGGSKSNVDLHAELLRSLPQSDLVHTYMHAFLGFAARLTDEEAKSISTRPGVVSVFLDVSYEIHTTHSWDFLDQQAVGPSESTIDGHNMTTAGNGADTIIGFLDTGIWPESRSFNDVGMPPIPSRWKGMCMEGDKFAFSGCNRKLIGARSYNDLSPRDNVGHGTHVASTASGRFVSGASYYGLAGGTARGGSTDSRIAMYRVCISIDDCPGSNILKGFEDAIFDGVDILSISLGSDKNASMDFSTDPIAIGSFHAVERGITVICSAGNDGPHPGTLSNAAPWILTVAATTIDRDFEANVILSGGNRIIQGAGINFSNLQKNPVYPLIDGESAAKQDSNLDARNCIPGSLDDSKVKGRIVMCQNFDMKTIYMFEKLQKQSGIIGMIMITDVSLGTINHVTPKFGDSPIVVVNRDDGAEILRYIKSSSNPMATILPTLVVSKYHPAPVVAFFSSRGPTPGILKPDIAAPGVNILAAWPEIITEDTVTGREPPRFVLLSGTSMACPHVAGLAAIVKSRHPTWGPSAIKSALMTTALHSGITTHTGEVATPHDIGAGEISLSGPIQPHLLYETDISDYVLFLCSIGYNTEKIRLIVQDVVAENFSCPTTSSFDMNYPSISIPKLKKGEVRSLTIFLSNVGEEEAKYIVVVETPRSVHVEVIPDQLSFTKGVRRMEFQIVFKLRKRLKRPVFGSIVWTNEKKAVRSPFVLNISSCLECFSYMFFLSQLLIGLFLY